MGLLMNFFKISCGPHFGHLRNAFVPSIAFYQTNISKHVLINHNLTVLMREMVFDNSQKKRFKCSLVKNIYLDELCLG